jgi:HD-like signal output (HDOD) protein
LKAKYFLDSDIQNGGGMLEPIEIDPKTFHREHCSLPSLPEAVIRIQGMLQDEATDSTMIAKIISGDPAIAAQVLAVVNSAYYSLPKTTSNIKYAVAYLGFSVIQRIVISVGVVNAMEIKEKNELNNYWYHSFFTALATKYLAKKFYSYLDPEELWTASILHDIGKLVYIKFFPAHYKELKQYCEKKGCFFSEAEEHYKLPASSYLGSLLCHHWRLPVKIEDACKYHNLLHISEQGSDFQTVIALGNLLATLSEGGLNESCKNRIREVAEKTLELSSNTFISIMADVYELKTEAEQFLRSL